MARRVRLLGRRHREAMEAKRLLRPSVERGQVGTIERNRAFTDAGFPDDV